MMSMFCISRHQARDVMTVAPQPLAATEKMVFSDVRLMHDAWQCATPVTACC
jgi:hypothetical protein